jgi:hypothetical protein
MKNIDEARYLDQVAGWMKIISAAGFLDQVVGWLMSRSEAKVLRSSRGVAHE